MAMYDNDKVQQSFDLSYVSDYLQHAQWAEMVELKKVIVEAAHAKGKPISILDIGIGNARVLQSLFPIKEIWNCIETYDGTDNAPVCIELSTKVIHELGIQHKVNLFLQDATHLHELNKTYDLIMTTWFTAGNFYPDDFLFETSNNRQMDLGYNPKFDKIFSTAWKMLNPGGMLLLGACYIDNDTTRLRQEEAYKKMGMTIITNASDSFTATKEGFWSQRFTVERLHQYLYFAVSTKITVTPLDTYNFALQVKAMK